MSLPQRCVLGACTFLAVMVHLLPAQDVSLSSIHWMDPARAPDDLPGVTPPAPLTVPPGLAQSDDYAYVVFNTVLDPKGAAYRIESHPSSPAFEQAGAPKFRFTPGKRDGKPVNTNVTFAVVYNPPKAAKGGADAAPRLLDVSTLRLRKKDAPAEPVVFAEVEVGTDGRVTAVGGAPEPLLPKMRIAVKNWRFAPARQGGQPVAARIRVPFVIDITNDGPPPARQTRPKVIHQQHPIYPRSMRYLGMRGEVLVEFLVDIEGRVINARALKTLNPVFNEPALTAVRAWRFEPGTLDGVPVVTRMQVPMVFTLNDTAQGGAAPVRTVRRGDVSKLPPQFQYDEPPELRWISRPVYPYSALQANRKGKAIVTYVVDEGGKVSQGIVKEASAPEFGEALLAAVSLFEYRPATRDGQPCKALLSFQQEFSRSFDDDLVSDRDLEMLRRENKKPQSFLGAAELDAVPAPRARQAPLFPPALKGVSSGETVIEFIVDEEGQARLPRVVSASHPAFGFAAAQAVATWQFEPPTHGGRPVAARVRVPVKFALKD